MLTQVYGVIQPASSISKFQRCKVKRQLITADVCIMIYDVSRETSFKEIKEIYNVARHVLPKESRKLLIGNKVDLEKDRQVDTATAKLYAELNKLHFLEMSMKQEPDKVKSMIEKTVKSELTRVC